MPKVYNVRNLHRPIGCKMVDRSTPYGNPSPMRCEADRDRVCDEFEAWVMLPEQAGLRAQAKAELKGFNLLCWCAPKRCHAETWLRIVNEE